MVDYQPKAAFNSQDQIDFENQFLILPISGVTQVHAAQGRDTDQDTQVDYFYSAVNVPLFLAFLGGKEGLAHLFPTILNTNPKSLDIYLTQAQESMEGMPFRLKK